MALRNKQSLSCISCGLREGVNSPKIPPYGEGRRGVLVIGEAPGVIEDRKGMPWQGRTGKLLQRTLDKLGLDLFEDCVSVNAVNCQPPDNRTPKPFEMECCRAVMVKDTIIKMKPKVIILMGASAVHSFLADRWPTDLGGITKWRGWCIPDQYYKAWVVPTYHPSFVLRAESKEYNTIWEQDLKLAIDAIDQTFPEEPHDSPTIHYITDLSVLDKYHTAEKMAFDYETPGLRPQLEGMSIVSASVAFNCHEVYSFLMPKTKAELRPLFTLLTNPHIKKMAHNMKFEHQWTLYRYGFEVVNWYWDSMLAAHQLDNRSGVTGLKFQTYVNFGIIYGDEVVPYLRKNENDPRGLNRIFELMEEPDGVKRLLRYGGLDSHYEFRLAERQLIALDYKLPF